MYILVATEEGGVYAARDQEMKKVVQLFVEEDDAVRYLEMLKADDFKENLEVTEVDVNVLVAVLVPVKLCHLAALTPPNALQQAAAVGSCKFVEDASTVVVISFT